MSKKKILTKETPRPGWEVCAKCQAAHPAYPFRLLTVRTLHIRDLGGEKRVQALGDFEDRAICETCAEETLSRIQAPLRYLLPRLLPFVLTGLIGALMSLFFWQKDQVFFLLGLAALACCLLGLYGTSREAFERKKEYAQKSKEEALRCAAYDSLLSCLPKKQEEEDLTYIPVDSYTLTRKNGDLMILYHLLPEIAVQAHATLLADKDNRPRS